MLSRIFGRKPSPAAAPAPVQSIPAVEVKGACPPMPGPPGTVSIEYDRGFFRGKYCAICPFGYTFHRTLFGANQCRKGGAEVKYESKRSGGGQTRYYKTTKDGAKKRISKEEYKRNS